VKLFIYYRRRERSSRLFVVIAEEIKNDYDGGNEKLLEACGFF
jgi:hypothetical protein